MNILARKPRPTYMEGAEVVLVKRTDDHHPYVVATITPHSFAGGEWHHGHYFPNLVRAAEFFEGYPDKRN